jgi:hypothetical protein
MPCSDEFLRCRSVESLRQVVRLWFGSTAARVSDQVAYCLPAGCVLDSQPSDLLVRGIEAGEAIRWWASVPPGCSPIVYLCIACAKCECSLMPRIVCGLSLELLADTSGRGCQLSWRRSASRSPRTQAPVSHRSSAVKGCPRVLEPPLRCRQPQQRPGMRTGEAKPCRRPPTVTHQLLDLVVKSAEPACTRSRYRRHPCRSDVSRPSDPRKAKPGLSVSSTAESSQRFHSSP